MVKQDDVKGAPVVNVRLDRASMQPRYVEVDDIRAAAFAEHLGRGVDLALIPRAEHGTYPRLGGGPLPLAPDIVPIQPGTTPPDGTLLVYRLSEYKGVPAGDLRVYERADVVNADVELHAIVSELAPSAVQPKEPFAAGFARAYVRQVEESGCIVPGSARVIIEGAHVTVEATLAGDVKLIPVSGIVGGSVHQFDVGQCSERGLRDYQEDALRADPFAGVFAVADGLGAGGDGDVAAEAAVARVVEVSVGREDWSAEKLCVESAHAADTAVRQAQSGVTGRCQTTLAVLVLRAGQAAVAWCGDSRVYRLRDGVLEQLTEDHRARLGDYVLRHTLARCLGARSVEESEADVRTLDARPGDVFALVTDGVGDTLPPERLASILAHSVFGGPVPAQATAEALVTEALDAGSRDNCTALVVRVGGAS